MMRGGTRLPMGAVPRLSLRPHGADTARGGFRICWARALAFSSPVEPTFAHYSPTRYITRHSRAQATASSGVASIILATSAAAAVAMPPLLRHMSRCC
jgi:hypothetical protein